MTRVMDMIARLSIMLITKISVESQFGQESVLGNFCSKRQSAFKQTPCHFSACRKLAYVVFGV
jgi:hypothetical protein